MSPNVSINLDAAQSCNWKCCLFCCHPRETDPIYITRKYQVKKLDLTYINCHEKIKETHERIEYYIRHKCESQNEAELSICRVKDELQIDISKKRDFITYGDLQRITQIVNDIVEL